MGVGTCGGVSLTYHMPVSTLHLPSGTFYPCLCTVIVVSANVAVQLSSHSFPVDISDPYCRWGKMCSILDIVESKGEFWSFALWVACMRLPSVRITRGPCGVLTLLLQGVSALM